MSDDELMRRALFHAARGRGATAPNPMVGAVVLSTDGVVVGQGWHRRAGDAHAEVVALDEAGVRARGGTLYVTLEPCCHHGRTAPCADRVIDSGVARVVVAMQDPDPRVNGRGLARLRAAGVQVDVGVLEAEARQLNRGFVLVQTRRRPEVILKAAISADGFIAERPGVRTTISGPAALRQAQRLRAEVDAVAVGSNTILVDDPLLTVRETVRARPLVRVIFDRRLRTPPTARVLSTLAEGPVIILAGHGGGDASDRAAALAAAGAVVRAADGRADLGLRALVDCDVSSVLVEGGARLHRALIEAGVVDVIHVVRTPRRLGAGGVPAFGGLDPTAGLVARLERRLGDDVWTEFDVYRNH